MPLIKNGAEIANEWTFVPDGAVLPDGASSPYRSGASSA